MLSSSEGIARMSSIGRIEMTSASIDPRTRELIFDLIRTEPLRPSEVLRNLIAKQQTTTQVQDALAILLDTGEIEMGSDRRLHLAQVAA